MNRLYNKTVKNIECISRAVILDDDGKILLCHAKKAGHFYLPGGHIELNEPAASALSREISEELGISLINFDFIGAFENFYTQDDSEVHEVTLLFNSLEKVSAKNLISKESHIDFSWHSPKDMCNINILPRGFDKVIEKWIEGKKIIWHGFK